MTDKTTTETDTLEDVLNRLPPAVSPPGANQDFYFLEIQKTRVFGWCMGYRSDRDEQQFYMEGEHLRHLAVEMYTELEDAGWL